MYRLGFLVFSIVNTLWVGTEVFNGKDIREYRALRISPGVQQSTAMQMTVPEGMSPDERPRRSSRSAGGSPTSGIVQVDKIGSEGRFHNARVEASSRHHGRTCTMNDLKSLISSKNTTSLLLERDLLLILHNP